MSKWREDRMFEIMTHLNDDDQLRSIYDMELIKSHAKYPRTEFFDRMEKYSNPIISNLFQDLTL